MKAGYPVEASFGEWLRARRNALDLTQFELAQRAGCAEDTIGRMEAGTRRPSKQVATLLAEALDVPTHSRADFVRFAREGGSGTALERTRSGENTGDREHMGAVSSPARPAPSAHTARTSHSHPAAWTPYLSTVPQPPTPLIGREADINAAAALLQSGHTRLLTLTGPPGVGKTRLAVALASALVPAFPDGICFVPLAPLRSPVLFTSAVAHALGLSEGMEGLQPSAVLDSVRNKRLLLVLDNFEHVMAAAPQVGEWLRSSVQLRMLVTSRSALQLRGERLFPVPTLSVPSELLAKPAAGTVPGSDRRADSSEPAALAAYPSVALFVERMQAADPGFHLTEANSRVVAELCRQMEGLPLAIELAAARSARLGPELVLARLQRRLDVVPGGTRSVPGDLPRHQQTLRAAIAWSYDLLGQAEQLLFARMSVFAGGATLDALEAVCNARNDLHPSPHGEGGLDAALEGLLQQSLVYWVDTETLRIEGEQDVHAGRRFGMLEMLREYAAERLAEWTDLHIRGGTSAIVPATHPGPNLATGAEEVAESEATILGRYHAEYYLAMAEAAEPELRLSRYDKWCHLLELELDNVRAALQWALKSGAKDVVLGVRLATAMELFWYGKGFHIEGIRWTEQLLERLDEVPMIYRAAFLISAGHLAWFRDMRRARQLFTKALDISRESGDKLHAAWALTFLSYVRMEEPEVALPMAEEGLALFHELNYLPGVAHNLNITGEIARISGDDEQAKRAYEECLVVCRQTGEIRRIGFMYWNLSIIAQHEGNYELALDLGRQALRLACDRKNRTDMTFGVVGVAIAFPAWRQSGAVADLDYALRTARLLGAAEAARERLGALIQPSDKLEYNRLVANVREQLDEATFRAAWVEGREMTLDDAVAAALEERR
jgi:predicted ATPase/transcriptional regulator with XRE-family HTH domain